MSTSEFIRKLKRWARKHDVSVEVKKHESKGSHRRVYLGDRKRRFRGRTISQSERFTPFSSNWEWMIPSDPP